MAMQKIIVSTHDWLYPLYGGGGPRTVKVAQELKKRGHNVILFGPSKKDEIDGIPVCHLAPPSKRFSQILSAARFNLGFLVHFLRVGRDADMIFVHTTLAAATTIFIKRFFKVKFVLDITDVIAGYLWVKEAGIIDRLTRGLLLAFELKIIKSADTLIVVTEVMRQYCIEQGVPPERITVACDGVDLSEGEITKNPDSQYNIIHLGIVDRQHGVKLLIRSAPFILKEFPNAHFFIVGDGREVKPIKKMARELGIYQNCTFTGYIEYPKVKAMVRKVNIGVIPRPDILVNNLIVTLKLLEYWSTGTAVVAARLKGIAEISEDKKDILFFEPGNHKDLAEKIIFLLRNPDETEKLQKNGLEKIKEFDWNRIIPKIADAVFN